jgi:hypothetical protein
VTPPATINPCLLRVQATKRNVARRNAEVPPEGLEQSRFPSGNTGGSDSSGSKSGNKGAGFGPATPAKPTDPELAAVIAAWSDLPPAVRAGITALVRAAKP